MAFTEDLSDFLDLSGPGVSVTAGAVSGVGILDANSEMILGSDAVMISYTLTVQTALFGNLKYGDTIVVDGNSYTVERQPSRLDDGAFCTIQLSRPDGIPTLGKDDLSAFLDLEGFGVPVTAGATSGVGILDVDSEVVMGGEVVMIDYLLTVPTQLFGGLNYGDSITVDGNNYKAEQQPMLFDDGALCRVPLAKIEGFTYLTTLSGLRLVTLDGRNLITLN